MQPSSPISPGSVHGTPFWKLAVRDHTTFSTFSLLIIAVAIQLLAIAGIFWSRAKFGHNFDPKIYSDFLEEGSSKSVADTFQIEETRRSRQSAAAALNDPSANEQLKRAKDELDQGRVRQIELDLVRQETQKRTENMLQQADVLWKKAQYDQAIAQLQAALQLNPEHLPAIMKMAVYQEERRDYAQARFQWEKASGMAQPQSAEMEEITQNLNRVSKLSSISKANQESPSPTNLRLLPPQIPGIPKYNTLSLASVTRSDLPLDDLYDLRFILKISLGSKGTESYTDISQVKVDVTFYDESTDGPGIPQTHRVLSSALHPKQMWLAGAEQVLLLNYSVPLGYFQKKAIRLGKNYKFCGYVVHVYYRGQLQDTLTEPGILSRAKP